jgi:hypothetical protein
MLKNRIAIAKIANSIFNKKIMEIIKICPNCGNPAIAVVESAVEYNLKKTLSFQSNKKWSICSNPVCEVSYFSKDLQFSLNDLINPLWFKDNGDNVPVCYCSDLTRGEIKNAVRQGCKTIDDVQELTNKNITGFCEERNPLGKCCRNVFLKTISDTD